jgi:hypothetical protein
VVVLAIVALSLYVWLSPTQQHLEEVSQLLNSVSARL